MIESDLSLMSFAVSVACWLFPSVEYLDPKLALAQFSAEIRSQLDLNVEALHLRSFVAMFANDPDISIPAPLYSNRDVLVLPVIQGLTLGKWMETDATPEARKRVAGTQTKKKKKKRKFCCSLVYQKLLE
jgi:predicted unusual protein kinase regulating ubiquinone biosynthesis (AarF/ABC1/UbiB family)